MNKCTKPAFTLIEILVVIGIMGFMAAIIVPRLAMRTPQAEWSTILVDLNDIIFFARQEAISEQCTHRLVFKHNKKGDDMVLIQKEVDDPEAPGKKKYAQVESEYFNTAYTFHSSIKLRAVYYGKLELMAENKGEGFCYIIADGLVQDVIVHLVRKPQDKGNEVLGSYILSPFFGEFEFKDGLVRPEG
ncbi:MAG: hypothetical protein US69_C0020G0003 [candidate division TM6 bacterium GW2011_GWF2_38_10]|nr:MAG: hypothetical protein US69_C0020G0003 [candidate division TM6 bacterium GW2011_GWF2_38_10]